MNAQPDWLMDLLEEEVHARIDDDPRTQASPGTFLGWPKGKIFFDVLGGGQADFDESLGDLTPEDRALLYARYNQARHLDELREAFRLLFDGSIQAGSPTLIDLGCGPITAGLALAAALGPGRAFRYHGIDRASGMRELGRRFADAAERREAFHPSTTWTFSDDLDKNDFGKIRGDLTLVVASYLLASPTLDVDGLVVSLLRALDRIGPGPVAILYTNSAKPGPNTKYPRFVDALLAGGFKILTDRTEKFEETRTPLELRYALLFRPAPATIRVRRGEP